MNADDGRPLRLAVCLEVAFRQHDVEAGSPSEVEANVVVRLDGTDVIALANCDDLSRPNFGIAREAQAVISAFGENLPRLAVSHGNRFRAICLRVSPRHVRDGVDRAGAHALVVGNRAVRHFKNCSGCVDRAVGTGAIGVAFLVAVVSRVGSRDFMGCRVDGAFDLLDRQFRIRRPQKGGNARNERRRHRGSVERSVALGALVEAREDIDAGSGNILRRIVVGPHGVRSIGFKRRHRHDVLEIGRVHRLGIRLVRSVVAVATSANRQNAFFTGLGDLVEERPIVRAEGVVAAEAHVDRMQTIDVAAHKILVGLHERRRFGPGIVRLVVEHLDRHDVRIATRARDADAVAGNARSDAGNVRPVPVQIAFRVGAGSDGARLYAARVGIPHVFGIDILLKILMIDADSSIQNSNAHAMLAERDLPRIGNVGAVFAPHGVRPRAEVILAVYVGVVEQIGYRIVVRLAALFASARSPRLGRAVGIRGRIFEQMVPEVRLSMHHAGNFLRLGDGFAYRGPFRQVDRHERAAFLRGLDDRLDRFRIEGLFHRSRESRARLKADAAVVGVVELNEDFPLDHIGTFVVDGLRSFGRRATWRRERRRGNEAARQRRGAEDRCRSAQVRPCQLFHALPLHTRNPLSTEHRRRAQQRMPPSGHACCCRQARSHTRHHRGRSRSARPCR